MFSPSFRSKRIFRWLVVLGGWLFAFPLPASPVIVLDAGHGGIDGGACWGGVREKTLTLIIAQRVEAVLKARGFRTAMTRRSDCTVSLGSRAAVANGYRSAMLVSIHCNADPQHQARGIETFYTGSAGYRLARSIHTRLDASTATPDRGVKRKGLTVLASSRCAAALVECGFMTSPSERHLLTTATYQRKIAQAIADGITASAR